MDGKQIEDREAVKAAVEALDAPPTSPPEAALRRTRRLGSRHRMSNPDVRLQLCRPRKSSG